MSELVPAPQLSLANAFYLPQVVPTLQMQQVKDVCAALRQARMMGLLVGLPGVGKTWAVQHAAQLEPEPDVFIASPVLYTTADVVNTPEALLHNLLNCLGPDHRTTVPDMTQMVCCWLHRRMVELIIIDEADRLDVISWELLRDIHERTRCAFLFVGQPGLQAAFYRNERLLNRVSLIIEMTPLTFDQLTAFVLQWQKKRGSGCAGGEWCLMPKRIASDLHCLKEIYRVTLGNLRRVQQFLEEAERVARVNDERFVELPVVQAVAQLLSGRHSL